MIKDAPPGEVKKQHWSDRHKVLISVVAWVTIIGSIAFLWVMGPAIR
jgi:hypothetical protein